MALIAPFLAARAALLTMAHFLGVPVQMMVEMTAQDYDPARGYIHFHSNCKKHDDIMFTICVSVCVLWI